MPSVTLSGFNNIDFSAILEAVMVQERTPFTALGTKKAALQQQNTQLGTLAGKLSTLQNAAERLASRDSLSVLTATSSDTAIVGVSTSSGTTPGVYDVVVSQRAKAQVTASTSTATADEVIATGGTLSLLVGAQPPVNIVASGSMTLRELADAINDADAGVAASVVQVTPGNYRLVLTSTQTGTDNALHLHQHARRRDHVWRRQRHLRRGRRRQRGGRGERRSDRQQRPRHEQHEHPHRRGAGRHPDAQRRERQTRPCG